MNTLIQEKANVVRLRTLLEKETDPLVQEFIQYRLGAARFRQDIAEFGVLAPERIEQVKTKARRRVRYTIIAISIAVILSIVLFVSSGCNTIREGCHLVGAAGQDVGWMANKIGDNIQTQEK